MLKILYIFGAKDGTLKLDPALLTSGVVEFQAQAEIQALKGGRLVMLDANGFVVPADDAGAAFAGILVNDAAGYDFENVPALASGQVTALFGGGIVETDQVVQDDVVSGADLYIGAGGQFTTVDPGTGTVVAKARTANSVEDKTLTIHLKG